MLWAYTIYSAALTPVVLAAFYSKRATAWGAVAAIGSGTAVTLTWSPFLLVLRLPWAESSLTLNWPGLNSFFPHILADRDAIFPALFAAVAALIFVSLLTRKPAAEQLAQFADWHRYAEQAEVSRKSTQEIADKIKLP
jgi:SSS family solute:Na+ symporter/sodium/proline symporter